MTPADHPQAGPCPDAAHLAAFHDGTLDHAAFDAVVAHTADCLRCRDLIGALERMRTADLPLVPETLKRDAAGPSPTVRRWQWPAAAAVAASLLVAVSLSRDARTPGQEVPTTAQPQALPGADDVRALGVGASPVLLVPESGQALGESPVTFRWTPVAGALQYRVQVLNGDGDIAWSATTSETSLEFGGKVESGRAYYTWVSAQMPDGRRVQSPVVRLTGPER